MNYTVDGANLSKTANISALMTIQPVTDGVIFTNSKDIDEDTTFLLLDSSDPNNSLFQKIDASEQLVQIIIEQNENFQILLPNSSEFISLGNNITLAGEDLNNLSQVSIKPIANFNGLTNLSISVQTVGVSNNEDDALSGDLTTQQAIIPITINAVADDLVIGTDGALLSEQVSNTQMFELFDSQTGNLLNEPIINDGRVDLETNLEIKLEIKDFSSLDSSEEVIAKISGDAITENTQIITGSGIGQVVFDSQEATAVPGTYEILIPGDGPSFAALEAENTSLIIPKVESGYGSKNILLELIGTDGDTTNIATTEVKSISILSTIPPEPLTGLSNDIQAIELSEDSLGVDGIKLNDLVRVPNLNESHIIQLIDLPEGVEIHVGENIVSEDNLRTHPQQEKMTSVQLTSEQFLNAFVKVPDDIIGGKNNLDFQVRVGTSDGNTSNGADTRFVFSRLVELNLNFGNQSTLNNDVIISEQENLNLGHGDDIAILSSKMGGSLSGGEGRDSISFNEFDDSQSVFIDMNMNKFLVTDNSENIESTNLIRQLDNFENIVGGKGDDTIVGSELNTTSLVLRGNEGDDHLVGGAGDDIIEGGEGVDLLAGSLGLNTFIINTNEGQDTILDFKSGDKLLFAGFNITHQSDGSLPPELKIKSSEGTNQDWIVEVTKITSEGTLFSSVVLSGLQNNYVSIEDVQNLLTSSIEFNDTLDLGSIDPEQSEFAFEFDALSIISDLQERNNFFGDTLNFSSATNSDDISDALGVIADSKYQEALIFTDAVSSKNLIDGFGDALNLEYKGLSGSEGNDVLVALDKDSVLYGGDGGSDRLIGGIGDDINDNRRLEDQRVSKISFGGDHLAGNLQIDWKVSTSKASEERPNERYVRFQNSSVPLNSIDLSDPEYPVFNFSGNEWNDPAEYGFRHFEQAQKYTEEEISLTGLYYKNDKSGKYIDRFNSRVIFPVKDLSGETIAFGGRIIRESKLAKYINSPETEFYKKGNMIFNLDKAKDLRSETDEVLIVEGYMDVVSVYSSGIKNVIANSGTAFTERQINLTWKFFSNPIICLDGDESGQKAALRIAEKLFPLINEKNKIFFSIMPEGKDPDDFIKQNGKEGLLSLLKEKQIIQSFIWNYHLSKIDQNNPYEISQFDNKMVHYKIIYNGPPNKFLIDFLFLENTFHLLNPAFKIKIYSNLVYGKLRISI